MMIFNSTFSINPHLLVLAYLDPGSGSFIIQLLIAGVAGAGILIGAYWKKIKRMFKRNPPVDENTLPKDDDDTPLKP